PQDFQRLFGVVNRSAEQCRFIGADLPLIVARRSVPGGGHYALVVLDFLVLDVDPMRQRSTGSFGESDAMTINRPSGRIPILRGRRDPVASLEVGHQVVEL